MTFRNRSFIVGLMMLVVAYNLRAAPVGLVLVAATVGLMIGFWFIERK